MNSRLIGALLALSSASTLAYQPNVTTGKPYKPIYVTDDKTLADFANRSLNLNSFDVTVSAPSEFMTFRGECQHWMEISGAQWDAPFRPSINEGDFFVFRSPEHCKQLNFNHIQIKPHDLKNNQLEIRLGAFKYAPMNRFTVREQFRDPNMDHEITLTADCHHEYTNAGFWTTDFFKCTLPENGGTLTFVVKNPLGL